MWHKNPAILLAYESVDRDADIVKHESEVRRQYAEFVIEGAGR